MKMVKIYDLYVNPDMVTSIEVSDHPINGKKGQFKIGLSGGDAARGVFAKKDGVLIHSIEDLVKAIESGKDLVN